MSDPSKGDWCLTVEDDLEEFDIFLDFQDSANIKKNKFKDLVKNACRQKALQDLKETKLKKSKLSKLKYCQLETKSYGRKKCYQLNFILKSKQRRLLRQSLKKNWP